MANKNIAATITIGGTMTAGLKGALGSTSNLLKDIGSQIGKIKDRQKQLTEVVRQAERAGKLGNAAGYAISELREVESRLNRMRIAQTRLNDAIKASERMNANAAKMRSVGAGMTVAGGAIIASAIPGVTQAKKYQTEVGRVAALGMGAGVNKAAEDNAKNLKQFGVSGLDKLELMRDALAVFGDLHHAEMALPTLAKMKFANKAFFGEHGGENEKAFMDMLKVIELRGGTKSEADFIKQANMVQRVISATGGRVGGEEWRHVIARGGLAAQGMRDDAFFYQLEPLVQMMSGDNVGTGLASAYQALYQGKTTKRAANNLDKLGLIADRSKVHNDKAGQIAQMDPGALLGADIFRQSQYEWVKQVLIPQLAKKGITSKDAIEDAIGSIVSNRVGANLLTKMYDQQQLIDKDEKRNRGSYDVDQLEGAAKGMAAGQEAEARAKYEDAMRKFGDTILPTYTKALVVATDALKSFNEFAERHGTLVKVAGVAVFGLGAGLTVLGPILVTAGGFMSAYAAIQLRAAAATAAGTTAIEAQGAAAVASTGKLAAFAKRLVGVLALANVGDYIAGKLGVGKDKADEKQDDANWSRMNWWQKGQSGVARGIEGAGRFIGMTNIADQAQADRVKAETEYLNKAYGKLPEAPGLRGGGAASAPVTQNNTFNITQQPGESQEQLARRILAEQMRLNAVKQRGSLTDGATAN
jgi:hypothetical protein